MNIAINGHHLEITPAIREYVLNKISRVLEHFDQVLDPHVQLFVEKHKQRAQITLRIPGKDVHCEATEDNVYAAIDVLADKLDRQMTKHKERATTGARPHQDLKRQTRAGFDTI